MNLPAMLRSSFSWIAVAGGAIAIAILVAVAQTSSRPVAPGPRSAGGSSSTLPPGAASASEPVRTATVPSTPDPNPCWVGPDIECSPPVYDVVDRTLGFTFAGGEPWSDALSSQPAMRAFGFGSCWDGICTKGYASVAVRQLNAEITVDASPNAAAPRSPVKGRTLEAIEASWLQAYPSSLANRLSIDGEPAIVLNAPESLCVIAIHAGRVYVIADRAPAFLPSAGVGTLKQHPALAAFLRGFAFLGAAAVD